MIALGTQQKINGGTLLVYGALKVVPLACDLDAGFVHPPTVSHRTLAPTTHSGEHWQHLDEPAVQRRVIDEAGVVLFSVQ